MKDYIIWKNKRNENKYIFIKRYADGHYYFKQVMKWDNGVENPLGQGLHHNRFFRVRKWWLNQIAEDYYRVG